MPVCCVQRPNSQKKRAMKSNIKLGLHLLNPVALLALLHAVLLKLIGNVNFPDLPFTTAAMQDLADRLEKAISQARFGSKEDRSRRDELVEETKAMLNITADYVRSAANGDATKLISSGFALRRQPEPLGMPEVPSKVEVLPTASATELEVRWPRVTGAFAYKVYRTANDPEQGGTWELVAFTKRVKFTVKGLETYKPYWFAVSSIGTHGESRASAPILGRAV
jgi:hypothetical protein